MENSLPNVTIPVWLNMKFKRKKNWMPHKGNGLFIYTIQVKIKY